MRKKKMGAPLHSDLNPAIPRDANAGVCKYCSCSDFDPCPDGCAWLDNRQTVCSACEATEIAERAAWLEYRPGRRYAGMLFEAFHGGFVCGWFNLNPKNKYGRRKNPTAFKYWSFGYVAGRKGRLIQQKYQAPITNSPAMRAKERRLERAMGREAHA